MDRGAALIGLGSLVSILGGRAAAQGERFVLSDGLHLTQTPSDIIIREADFRSLIIYRENGKVVEIPFSKIVDALEE